MNRIVFLILLTPVIFSGCLATTEDMVDLQSSITELQREISNLRKNQATLSTEMNELNKNMGVLTEKLDENKKYMSSVAQRVEDLSTNFEDQTKKIISRLPPFLATAGTEPTPTEVYNLAYADYSSSKYDLAIIQFEGYIKRYPQSERVADAQYYLAECYYNKNDWEKSAEEYGKLRTGYPRSDKVLSAELKKGYALYAVSKTTEAVNSFKWLLDTSPNSPEGKLAKQRLDTIQKK